MQVRQRGPGPQIRSPPPEERPPQRARVHSAEAGPSTSHAAPADPSTSHAVPRRVTAVDPRSSYAPPRRSPDVGPSVVHGAFAYLPEPAVRYWGTSGRLSRSVLSPNSEDSPSFVPPTATHVSVVRSCHLL